MSVVVHMRIVIKGDVSVTQDIPEIRQINVQVRYDSESYNVTLFAFATIEITVLLLVCSNLLKPNSGSRW